MPDDIAIRVEALGKCYPLASARGAARYRTLREDLIAWPRRLLERARHRPVSEQFWALCDVSFEVNRGEIVGIIGRNGAGKSTLLKILSRITAPTAGGADLFGRVGSLLEVGTGFHPELTGRENIFLSGALLGLRRADVRRRFDEIVAFAEVEKFLDTPCKHYSSGMFLRLGFAVAAHLDAEILLVDEILAVGDVQFQKKCLGKMNDVARGGRTVILVSHDLEAIRRLAQRVLWIDHGTIAQQGAAGDMVDRYLQAARGSGSVPTNAVAFERGDRSIWFARATLGGPGGRERISMGEAVTLTFEAGADAACANKPVCFAIGIRTEDGFPVALVADADSGFRLANGIGSAKRISVCFDGLSLYPGYYFLRLWVGSPDGVETYDDRQDCLVLYVADSGKLTQRRLLRHQGVIFLQPRWEIAS